MTQIGITGLLQNIFEIFDPEWLFRNGGLLIVLLIVYGTTGLFFCFFLPGGAVLFATGVFVAPGGLHYSSPLVCGLLIFASVLGNITGYWLKAYLFSPFLYSFAKLPTQFSRDQSVVVTIDIFVRRW